MSSIKLSEIKKEDIKARKIKDGKLYVQLKDDIWYELIKDRFYADANGGPIMAYINNLSDDE